MNKKIKVIITDNNKLVRDGYKAILSYNNDINVIGDACNGLELIELLSQNIVPDIILLDIEMPVMDGIDALKIIAKKYPNVKVLIVSVHDSDMLIAHCLLFGAHGYVTKDMDGEVMIQAIHAIMKDGFFFNSYISRIYLNEIMKGKDSSFSLDSILLTNTEKEVIGLICREFSSKSIAESMNVSENTIEFHRKNIIKKINCKSVVGIVKYAFYHGIGG